LLIVIAIIAILAAMLLPALNRARDRAHSTKCVANLKTYTMSGLTYANDSNDYLVPADPTNVTVCIWYRNAAFRRLSGSAPRRWTAPMTGRAIRGCSARRLRQTPPAGRGRITATPTG